MPVVASDVTFPGTGTTLHGYVAAPGPARHWPALVLIPDVRGLADHYRDVTRRFAAEGFVTLAPDLYSREGPPVLADVPAALAFMRTLPDARVLGDVAAALDHLRGRADVRSDAIGITGFCMGGQYALMAACTLPGFAACVSWYGMLRYAEKSPIKPVDNLDIAPRLACPYLGLFGADDALIPPQDVEALRARLQDAATAWTIEVYPGAGHAFFNDTRPETFRPEVAARAWTTALAFLRHTLV